MDWLVSLQKAIARFLSEHYRFYVWGSYLTALILLGGEVLLLMRRKKSLRKRVNRDPR